MTIFPNYVCQKCGFKLASPSEECVACGFKEVRIYTVKDAGEINRLQSELTKYKKACEVLRESNRFYGDKDNWYHEEDTLVFLNCSDDSGKRARQAEKQVKEILGE